MQLDKHVGFKDLRTAFLTSFVGQRVETTSFLLYVRLCLGRIPIPKACRICISIYWKKASYDVQMDVSPIQLASILGEILIQCHYSQRMN